MECFEDSKELLHASYDAYEALLPAYEKNNRLHRDISTGNVILIWNEASGRRQSILADWEFSVQMDEEGKARDFAKTVDLSYTPATSSPIYIFQGTWKFMSIRIISEPGGQHSVQDDMEFGARPQPS